MTLAQGSAGQPRDHLHGRAGAGREPRVSGEGGGDSREGKSYFLNDPSGLEQLLLRDVEEHTGVTAVEKTDHAQGGQAGRDSGWRGHGDAPRAARLRALSGAAHLGHHSGGGPRRSAAGALAVRPGPRRGVHLRRQEPLGRQLGDLAGLRPLVGQHFPRPAAARAAERDHAPISTAPPTSWWWITAFRATWRSRPRCPTSIAFGPDGFQAPLKVGKVAAGPLSRRAWRSAQNQGLFRVRPLAESRAFPEVGFYRQEDEMLEYGNNEQLLRQIAASTGGRLQSAARRRLRRRRPQHPHDDGTCGRACWRWPSR